MCCCVHYTIINILYVYLFDIYIFYLIHFICIAPDNYAVMGAVLFLVL